MEYIVLTMIGFLGLCFSIAVLWRIPYGFAPLFALSYIGIGGYVAACFNLLTHFNVLNIFLGLFSILPSFFFSLYTSRKTVSAQQEHVCNVKNADYTIGAVHVFLQVYTVWYFYGAKIRYYDEFYWMTLTRDLFETGGLLSIASPIMESFVPTVHPPLASILQSFFSTNGLAFLGIGTQVFHEGSAGIAGCSVLLALGSIVATLCRKYMPTWQAILVAVLVFCIARLFGSNFKENMYTMAYMEYYQAALFSLGISISCFMQRSALQTLALICTVVLLTSTKATSFLFALGFVCTYFIYNYFCYKKDKNNISFRHVIKVTCFLLLGIVLSRLVWVYHITEVVQQFLQNTTASSELTMLADTVAKKQMGLFERIKNFMFVSDAFQQFKNVPWEVLQIWGRAFLVFPLVYSAWLPMEFMSIFFTVLPIYIAFTLAYGISYFSLKMRMNKEHAIVLLVLSLGLLAWFFLRIVIAVHMHSEREIYNAASYSRYIGAYVAAIVALMALMFYTTLAKYCEKHKNIFAIILVAHVALTLLLAGFKPWVAPRHIALPESRLTLERAVQYVEQNTPESSRIWFINQGKDLLGNSIFRFLMMPNRRTDFKLPWAVSIDVHEKDRVLDVDAMKQKAEAKNIDYIFIWNEKENIQYILNGQKLQSQGKPVLISLKNSTKNSP